MENGAIVNKTDLRASLRQSPGSLIWARQTSPDIGFNIAKIATDAVSARLETALAFKITLLYNKTVRLLGNPPGRYDISPVLLKRQRDRPSGELQQIRMASFSDDGFGPLKDSRSREGTFIVRGNAIARGGPIQRHGYLIDHRCAKIHRCVSKFDGGRASSGDICSRSSHAAPNVAQGTGRGAIRSISPQLITIWKSIFAGT